MAFREENLNKTKSLFGRVSLEYTEYTFIKKEASLARGKNIQNHSCAVAEVQFTRIIFQVKANGD